MRERCELGDEVVIGRGSHVENDTSIGARAPRSGERVRHGLLDAGGGRLHRPCVVTTNDNYMGRTEARLAEMRGPTIRRGARIGGGAVLLPGVEIGEEAFVGAGAVVLDDVPARAVVVGNPARKIRDVPDDELLS